MGNQTGKRTTATRQTSTHQHVPSHQATKPFQKRTVSYQATNNHFTNRAKVNGDNVIPKQNTKTIRSCPCSVLGGRQHAPPCRLQPSPSEFVRQWNRVKRIHKQPCFRCATQGKAADSCDHKPLDQCRKQPVVQQNRHNNSKSPAQA